ncbi:MAG TPA: hypothetical protein VF233_13055 [Nitrososphaeraceae archaeon]
MRKTPAIYPFLFKNLSNKAVPFKPSISRKKEEEIDHHLAGHSTNKMHGLNAGPR